MRWWDAASTASETAASTASETAASTASETAPWASIVAGRLTAQRTGRTGGSRIDFRVKRAARRHAIRQYFGSMASGGELFATRHEIEH